MIDTRGENFHFCRFSTFFEGALFLFFKCTIFHFCRFSKIREMFSRFAEGLYVKCLRDAVQFERHSAEIFSRFAEGLYVKCRSASLRDAAQFERHSAASIS